MSLILFHFESNEIRVVGTAENPEWVAADICKILQLNDVSDAVSKLDADERGRALIPDGSVTGSQMLTVTESGLYTLILRHRQATTAGTTAHRFRKWVTSEVLPSIRKTGAYQTQENKQSLERALLIPATTKNILDSIKIAKAAKLPLAYIQRLGIQGIKQISPGSELPNSSELVSLPTARALLTPTQLAEELGWKYKTGRGNAQQVNTMLLRLGYQEIIADRWSATPKAIDANLVDRKPVETNSKVQKDQLLWSADMISILQEHSFTA